jgi:hypothetical protein
LVLCQVRGNHELYLKPCSDSHVHNDFRLDNQVRSVITRRLLGHMWSNKGTNNHTVWTKCWKVNLVIYICVHSGSHESAKQKTPYSQWWSLPDPDFWRGLDRSLAGDKFTFQILSLWSPHCTECLVKAKQGGGNETLSNSATTYNMWCSAVREWAVGGRDTAMRYPTITGWFGIYIYIYIYLYSLSFSCCCKLL